jgi:hypothetical protein
VAKNASLEAVAKFRWLWSGLDSDQFVVVVICPVGVLKMPPEQGFYG